MAWRGSGLFHPQLCWSWCLQRQQWSLAHLTTIITAKTSWGHGKTILALRYLVLLVLYNVDGLLLVMPKTIYWATADSKVQPARWFHEMRDLCLDSSFESNSPSYRCFAFCFLSLGLCVLLVLFHYGMRGDFRVFVLNVNGILRWQEYILVLVPGHMNYFSNRVVIKNSSKSQLQKCWCWLRDYWDWKKNVAFIETFSPNTIFNKKKN